MELGTFWMCLNPRAATDLLNDSALIGATDPSGKSIFVGKKFTGFSNAEEEIAGFTKVGVGQHEGFTASLTEMYMQDVPFLLEDKIQTLGGIYEKAAEPWAVSVSIQLYEIMFG